jgi:hypothetical protein
MKKRRTLSPEHLAKLQAGRERHRKYPGIHQSTSEILPPLKPEPVKDDEVITLDVTRENLVNETDLIERIRRMFDVGNTPTLIKVNSSQLLEILDNSNRFTGTAYNSPFCPIDVKVVSLKDINEVN